MGFLLNFSSPQVIQEGQSLESQESLHTQEIQTNEHGQILITGEDGQTYPVQVGHCILIIVIINVRCLVTN